ncbi:MAG: phage holin family protein [Polyangiaceae bacterium]|jgi:putative membrane protein|nr:phage holin family protein [Polyangiaceae bacterium]
MLYTLIHLAALSGLVLLLARMVPGVRVRSTGSAVAVAVVFSLLNWVIGWLVTGMVAVLLFLPAILTLGLLFLVIPLVANAVLLWLTDKFLDSFELRGSKPFWLTAIAITIGNALLEAALNPHTQELARRGTWA